MGICRAGEGTEGGSEGGCSLGGSEGGDWARLEMLGAPVAPPSREGPGRGLLQNGMLGLNSPPGQNGRPNI